ncbi:RrF2 family transcriptional regulator [Anaeromicrobium sediminis]|uniref:Transcriptional regulator n=1 Tax=Anaeromicrobium sediminis TaxID=1478221 RepID=A0A267MJY1_9FIRM|nr:Rrf2 family transcriptional regulator [Anaeromicrobium sediminis]PAB59901.1 transcriptional regulator [Anaeromicrobium sediminis]
MKITQEADYALRIILYLSKLGVGAKTEANQISDELHIPKRFTLKIMRKLAHSGIVKSYRGVNGGYALDKEPKRVTFKDVIETIDGPICVNRCLIDKNLCNLNIAHKCTIHKALGNTQKMLNDELASINFGDLL